MDTKRCLAVVGGMAVTIAIVSQPVTAVAQASGTPKREAPARKVYTPARTPWGDPDISGVYTNNDESLIPFERPAQFAGRRLEDITPAELENAARAAQRRSVDAKPTAIARSSAARMHWFENFFPQNSRAWLVIDPPDGKVPPHDRRGAAAQPPPAPATQRRPRSGRLAPKIAACTTAASRAVFPAR